MNIYLFRITLINVISQAYSATQKYSDSFKFKKKNFEIKIKKMSWIKFVVKYLYIQVFSIFNFK